MTSPRLGIVGCGDFLRLQETGINQTEGVRVTALFDPMAERAKTYADRWDARVCASAEEVLDADDVDIALIFVPPWARTPLLVRAAANGKHVMTTKPFAPSIEECETMVAAAQKAGITAGVIYNRTESPLVQTLKSIFDGGEIGKLALFKQDWLHHYPHWNTWALDPEKNGGPFMDAMIHNLNIARHLMGRPAVRGTMFSDRHAHFDLPCVDTELLKLDFTDHGAAHLFITWAADLNLLPGEGNFREHVDIWYAVTDQGWRVTEAKADGQTVLSATRMGEIRTWPLEKLAGTPLDDLLAVMRGERPSFKRLAPLEEAAGDIRIIRTTCANAGQPVEL